MSVALGLDVGMKLQRRDYPWTTDGVCDPSSNISSSHDSSTSLTLWTLPVQKLQTLLSAAPNTDGIMFPSEESDASAMFRDDVKVALQSSSLSEWLLKVSSVKGGVLGDGDAGFDGSGERKKDKGRDEEEGEERLDWACHSLRSCILSILITNRRSRLRLHGQVPVVSCPVSQNHSTLPAALPFSPTVEASRAESWQYVELDQHSTGYDVLEPHLRRLDHELARFAAVDQLLGDHDDTNLPYLNAKTVICVEFGSFHISSENAILMPLVGRLYRPLAGDDRCVYISDAIIIFEAVLSV
ncbi:hypothetical protein BU17DRAFT_80827 [Hysterangium stoloniferum]|nr:hypothetical protein BU17DRAFT_80827 [Hysterangium stoloniferum]